MVTKKNDQHNTRNHQTQNTRIPTTLEKNDDRQKIHKKTHHPDRNPGPEIQGPTKNHQPTTPNQPPKNGETNPQNLQKT